MTLYSTLMKEKEYWLVDQLKKDGITDRGYREAFLELLERWRNQEVGYLSLLMDETHEDWLMETGFHKVSSIVEYTRPLDTLQEGITSVFESILSESSVKDEEFARLYEKCRSGSANKNQLFTIEQVMESFELELGKNWRTHCVIFNLDSEAVGLSIPHIEPGTDSEGRLFYFGVVPDWRGKGIGRASHRRSLEILKKRYGASVYVGSTDTANAGMIHIFEKNGCVLRDRKGIFRLNQSRFL